MDPKIIQVALNGLVNILKLGETEAKQAGQNPYAVMIEECYGQSLGRCYRREATGSAAPLIDM